MNTLKCQKCGGDVPIPDLPTEVRKDVAAIAHRVGRSQATLELKNRGGFGLGDAKAIVFHISGADGVCHRCGTNLIKGLEEQACPKCRSLNLVW